MEPQRHRGHQETQSAVSSDMDHLAYQVIGAAIEVHRTLGPGFLESVYEHALAVELTLRDIAFERQIPIGIDYKGHIVGEGRLDFLIKNQLVVELKAVEQLIPIHTAQVISYLSTLKQPLGLLINFNVEVLKTGIKRIIVS
ncbi:MAG: GxxExxY protein [Armatimonadetes bacterium]|nr:GxxExxY protein [Anaerolineae bacterium]